ncbi:zinc-dependent metalloprotease [Pedobacter ginsengisoli]|uniref:zinc-dependent metalloprotease n=1 Tax=Pedobacter ginsengisoli TaxID=363852 RepID=UPI00254A1FBE|nr:zinc-dependent metalloprotease [Pedobacter ginsengisoli]
MKYSKFIILYGLVMVCFSCRIFKKPQKKAPVASAATTKNLADTTKEAAPSKLKPYEEVITKKAVTGIGLIKVHRVEEKYFFEIPNSLLEKDLLIVNRIYKGAIGASAGMLGYRGDQINEKVVRLAKGLNYKLFLKSMSYTERAADSSDNGMYRSVRNSSLQPIVAAFDIKAVNKDSTASVIDVTDYLNADNEVLFFDSKVKTALKLSGLQADKSYTTAVRTFPENVEIRTMKTYSTAEPGKNATYELNSSIIRLPEQLMLPRSFDERVGYFATGYTDFDSNPQGVAKTSMITRWRLEPKKEDEQRYLKGELVEPKQPIVFYIDPATPKKWVPYLIQGVEDWNQAFEAAGFENAVIAKEAPVNDSTWSMESARHNVIVYKPSAVPNASGAHVHDPRTGEILETHVNWYHNVMQLLRNWYFIQASTVDPKARKMKFDDALMGQLIRFVSSHEIGHTLGLRHNFGSSSTVPVEKLRDKAWVEANGHTPSIMDYARFNYVAQPEDGISEKGIFPRIGDYDKWAIEWGYRWHPEMDKAKEKIFLNNWIIAKTSGNKRLWFGTETNTSDPRCQSEDLGDNATLASAYGIKNLKRILPNILTWTKEENEGYDNAKMMYGELLQQYDMYLGHVVRNVGGIMFNAKVVESKGDFVNFVPKNRQKEAVRFINQQLFNTPMWLLNKDLFKNTGAAGLPGVISNAQNKVLVKLLDMGTLSNMHQSLTLYGKNAYGPAEMLQELRNNIFNELYTGKAISIYRRNLQKSYLDRLMQVLKPKSPPFPGTGPELNDVSTIVKMEIRSLQGLFKNAVAKTGDRMSKAHLVDLDERIEDFYKDKK